jgi:hypothetical protein
MIKSIKILDYSLDIIESNTNNLYRVDPCVMLALM